MDYKKTAMIVTTALFVFFLIWTGVRFKKHVGAFGYSNEKYPMPYGMNLTDSTNLAKLNTLYIKCMEDTIDFVYYNLVKQENGFVVAVAVNGKNPDRIVRFGVPVQVRFGGFVDIDENPITTCRTISGCIEGSRPYYNGEYDWKVTDCEKAVSLYPQCMKSTSFRLPEWEEEKLRKENKEIPQ